jgi:uncharacterized membrane protein
VNNFRFKRITVFVLMILIALPLIITTKAESRSYDVSSYDIHVNITPNGCAEVQENITFNFNGTFQGVYLNIDTSGSDGIENMKLSSLKGDSEITIISSNSGQPETYTLSKDGTINNYKVYEPSSNENKTFIFRYRLLNVITNYKDVAEFDRLVIAKNWQSQLNNVKISITLPAGAKKEDLKIFSHGPLTGNSTIVDGNTVEFSDSLVPAYTFLESIVLFPPSLTPDSIKKSADERLPTVLQRESVLANQANKQRDEARQITANEKNMHNIENVMAGFLFLIWLILLLHLYFKYDKEIRPEFDGKYYRELPGNYSPAEMTIVMGGSPGSKDIMATLLDLTRRKHIKIDKVDFEKKGIFHSKKGEDYEFTSLENDSDALTFHEKFLINWLINTIGNGSSFSINDIKEYAKEKTKAIEFTNSYKAWKSAVDDDFKKLGINDTSIAHGKTLGVFMGLLNVAIGFVYVMALNNTSGIFLIIMGFIMTIYSGMFKRRTKYGSDQHSKWRAFKRFLEDFSQMKSANISSLVVWEQYLVYAVSLGVAHNVIKYLPEIVGVQELDNASMMNGMLFWQIGGFNAFNNAFNSSITAINTAVISAQSVAASANSSGSGGGGGFSGGGGFGGGGGGGGGAF